MASTDASEPDAVDQLIATLTLPEKLAQLQGLWIHADETGGVVAPEMGSAKPAGEFAEVAENGLGQLTRVYGTAPITPAEGLARLIGYQRWVAEHTRARIGVLAHEECLTGLNTWTATTYPTPLAWAATFDPELVETMGAQIGQTMAALGIHQGLAPVLDVVRDVRWGRVEETMGEDPYVIGELATAYVRGVQSRGVVATLKHFMGYSGSQGGRNLAPVHVGPREILDVFAIPFEMAVLDGHAQSVMPAYVDIDGVPMHAHHGYLTGLLRDQWGFTGTVVSDYFGVEFLQRQHGVVEGLGEAGAASLRAGNDVELPTGVCLRQPLLDVIAEDPELVRVVDRALRRVLRQKQALGLLDIDAEIARLEELAKDVPDTLDPPEHRATAGQIAAESVVLLENSGLLPLAPRAGLKLAVVGPNADRAEALFGCYSFVNHVLMHHPDAERRLDAPTVLDALRAEYPDATLTYARGCAVLADPADDDAIAEAVAAARQADVVVAVVGDQSGLFGAGTSGEGCDAGSLDLPGRQTELVEALLATGRPVVLVAVTGRPYAIGGLAGRAAATVQAFFPGEEGAAALAGVLSGRVNPSGRLPVSVPKSTGTAPYSYLHAALGDPNGVSSIDCSPAYSFGHGLSYTTFQVRDFALASDDVPTDGWVEVSATVANTGARAGSYLLQVYAHDVVAQVARPARQLIGFVRVPVDAGASVAVRMRVPATRLAYADLETLRIVEPGDVRVWLGDDADHPVTDVLTAHLSGPAMTVTPASPRLCEVSLG